MNNASVIPASTKLRGSFQLATLTLALGLLASGFAAPSTGSPVPGFEACETAIPKIMADWHIPGAAAAIAFDGRIVYARGFGYADPESGRLAQPDTRFRVASLSKPITAALILKLVEDGRLSLDDRAFPLLAYDTPVYPGARRDSRLDQITIRQLLSHTAGWNRDTAIAPFPVIGGQFEPTYYQIQIAQAMGVPSPASAAITARYMVGQPLQFTPGAGFAYSNVGFLMLGRVIEAKTGLSYETAAQQFLAAAGISEARIAAAPRSTVPADEAVAYDDPGSALLPSPWTGELVSRAYAGSPRTLDAHGGWAISALDYLRFLLALDGAAGTERLLSPASIAAMRSEQYPGVGYGFGWFTRYGTTGWSGHDGVLPGTRTWAMRSTDGRFEWVLMFNGGPDDAPAFDNAVFDCLRATETALRASARVDAEFNATTLSWSGWKQMHHLAATTDTNDSDADGTPDLIDYAGGLDPFATDVAAAASIGLRQDGTPVLTYRRLVLGESVRWHVEQSADGVAWSTSDETNARRSLNSDGTWSISVPVPGARSARLVVAHAGTTAGASVTLATPFAPGARLVNLSARARAGQGNDTLTVGFAVEGEAARRILVRGIGPALAQFGVSAPASDPGLGLFTGAGRLTAANDNWLVNHDELVAAAKECGAFALPDGSADAGLTATLRPGIYTAQLASTQVAGEALVELYELDQGASQAVNLSCRSRVGGTWGELTAGFTVRDGSRQVLLRAVGPTLRHFGLADALSRPVLTVFHDGQVVARNGGWSAAGDAAAAVASAALRAGAFALDAGSTDAAIVLTLEPGGYTVQVQSADDQSGIALAEIYDVR